MMLLRGTDPALDSDRPAVPGGRRQPAGGLDGRDPACGSYVIFAYMIAAHAALAWRASSSAGSSTARASIPAPAYLLGPVAAVVLGGAALSGGLASATSTWAAAFFVTILNQMLIVLGLLELVADRRVRAGDHPRHDDLRRPHRRHRRAASCCGPGIRILIGRTTLEPPSTSRRHPRAGPLIAESRPRQPRTHTDEQPQHRGRAHVTRHHRSNMQGTAGRDCRALLLRARRRRVRRRR